MDFTGPKMVLPEHKFQSSYSYAKFKDTGSPLYLTTLINAMLQLM